MFFWVWLDMKDESMGFEWPRKKLLEVTIEQAWEFGI